MVVCDLPVPADVFGRLASYTRIIIKSLAEKSPSFVNHVKILKVLFQSFHDQIVAF